jgi:hypothetical protein
MRLLTSAALFTTAVILVAGVHLNKDRKSKHEAGHAAVALHLGMFGEFGITIIDTPDEAGSVSIGWNLGQLRFPDKIELRATIVMAGIAAEPPGLRPELNAREINWRTICIICEDLRDDIQKARCLGWISRRVPTIWKEQIEPYLAGTPQAGLDDIVTHLRKLPEYETDASYEVVEAPLAAAKAILSMPQPSCFVEKASRHLLEYGSLTSQQCRELWTDCRVRKGVSWLCRKLR